MMRFLSALILAGVAIPSQAGLLADCCPNCGCHQLQKVCRVVPDVKKVTQTKYTVESEDVCVQGKTRCEERLVADANCPNGLRCETVQVPTCDRIVTKKKIKKVTTTVEKPTFKCVVDTVCSQCGTNCCGK